MIVTADDFGLHQSVNEAVERAVTAGILTAASLMVGAAACADAVARVRGVPALRVGLHLVIADGQAVLPRRLIPDLVDADGRFGSRMVHDGIRFFAIPRVRKQLAAEIRAQFEAFARTGLSLDHVNAHKHFHLHPTVLDMILRIGPEFGMRAVRMPAEPRWFSHGSGGSTALAGAALLSPWLALMKRRLRMNGLDCNDQLFGIACSGGLDERTLLHILAKLPPGVTEIYLHPAVLESGLISESMRSYRHVDEFSALVSPRVRAALDATGAVCGGFSDMSATREPRLDRPPAD